MIPSPEILFNALESQFGSPILRVTELSGGMINHAARVDLKNGPIFVKWHLDAPPLFYDCEADGLRRLRDSGCIKVPDVLLACERTPECPAFLALGYIEERPPRDPRAFAKRFGEALAELHMTQTAPDRKFGLDRNNYMGAHPQPNTSHTSWPAFYRDRRLTPQIERAKACGRLFPYRERLLQHVVEQTDSLLADTPSHPPTLVHGDLWSGNFLTAGDEPVLIDPAVYYADREVEIAYIQLFGGFPTGFVNAYNNAFPLDACYMRRRPLLQLYPLLLHLNHFGEGYGPRVDEACRDCLEAGLILPDLMSTSESD